MELAEDGFFPKTQITAISVGDEVLTTVPSSSPLLVTAIESLYTALVAANLHTQIKISSPHAASIVLDPFPPSQAFFNQSLFQSIPDPVCITIASILVLGS
ncbi:Glucan endo-1,3-beta-glucosidase 1 [Camellia lanceoleosa]|uniref:Glucan endo-1,3-beta-glucosidase 1 n=1 Tax=Camellia lanceoleosa TaxID=1840588 RepID=A0ACC0FZM3_9ERIC|nr:Glucan endo-1,3-beta-glucosidase 1 [Camellia lanceoleosa]